MKRKALIWLRIWSVRLAYAAARVLPVKRRVVLATGNIRGDPRGPRGDPGGDRAPRPDDPVVILLHDARAGRRRDALLGVARGLEAGYHLATAALFVVDSHYLPIYVIKRRPGTTIVQTWHACGAIKKIGYSVLDKSFGADETLVEPRAPAYELRPLPGGLAGGGRPVHGRVPAAGRPVRDQSRHPADRRPRQRDGRREPWRRRSAGGMRSPTAAGSSSTPPRSAARA